MLLRIERLRQAVINMQGELQKNRSSLQVIRQGFQRSQPNNNNEQPEPESPKMLALPSSPSSPVIPAPRAAPAPGGRSISVTCDVSAPIFTAELKDILDREEDDERYDAKGVGSPHST